MSIRVREGQLIGIHDFSSNLSCINMHIRLDKIMLGGTGPTGTTLSPPLVVRQVTLPSTSPLRALNLAEILNPSC